MVLLCNLSASIANISQIHATAKQLELKDNNLKTVIRNLIKQNKKEYSFDFIKLTVQVSQIGQMFFTTAAESIKTIFNFLTATISHWHHEVSELHMRNIFQ